MKIVIPRMTQVSVLVQDEMGGLCLVRNHSRLVHRNVSLMNDGIIDISQRRPFI